MQYSNVLFSHKCSELFGLKFNFHSNYDLNKSAEHCMHIALLVNQIIAFSLFNAILAELWAKPI